MAKTPTPDPKLAKDACFKCGSKLVERATETHETRGKKLDRWRTAYGGPIVHRVLVCVPCGKVRAVAGSGSQL